MSSSQLLPLFFYFYHQK